MSDMEAGAAAGIGLRVLIGPRDAKTGEPPYEVVADLGEARSHSFDLALRRLRLISARGLILGDSMLELHVLPSDGAAVPLFALG